MICFKVRPMWYRKAKMLVKTMYLTYLKSVLCLQEYQKPSNVVIIKMINDVCREL